MDVDEPLNSKHTLHILLWFLLIKWFSFSKVMCLFLSEVLSFVKLSMFTQQILWKYDNNQIRKFLITDNKPHLLEKQKGKKKRNRKENEPNNSIKFQTILHVLSTRIHIEYKSTQVMRTHPNFVVLWPSTWVAFLNGQTL